MNKEYQEWLKSLTVGDVVALEQGKTYKKLTVQRLTATRIYFEKDQWAHAKDGSIPRSHTSQFVGFRRIVPPTAAIKAQWKEDEATWAERNAQHKAYEAEVAAMPDVSRRTLERFLNQLRGDLEQQKFNASRKADHIIQDVKRFQDQQNEGRRNYAGTCGIMQAAAPQFEAMVAVISELEDLLESAAALFGESPKKPEDYY